VTGTFDNWSKSEELEKVDNVWQKTVTLPDSSDKILYKVGCFFFQFHFRMAVAGVARGVERVGESDNLTRQS